MPRPRPLRPDEVRRTLVGRFEQRPGGQPGLVDRLRQLYTKFGARSRRLRLVWGKWSGFDTGEGHFTVVHEFEILPTPRIEGTAQKNPFSAGALPVGTIRVSEVSPGIGADTLLGRMVPGHGPPEPPYEFFYEVFEDGRSTDERGQPYPPLRERYRLMGLPERRETELEWTFLLERSSEDRARNGDVNEDGLPVDRT